MKDGISDSDAWRSISGRNILSLKSACGALFIYIYIYISVLVVDL